MTTEILPHDIHVFVLLFDGHTLKSISETLEMPLPTVRASLTRLRAVIGEPDKLFVPKPDYSYAPTQLAVLLEPQFRNCSRQFGKLNGQIEEFRRSFSKGSRHFAIGIPSLYHASAPELVNLMQRAYPDATFAVQVFQPHEREAIVDRLAFQTLDAVIDFEHKPYQKFESELLLTSDYTLVSAPEFPGTDPEEIMRECTYLRTGIIAPDKAFPRGLPGLLAPHDFQRMIFIGDFFTILPSCLCSTWSKKSPTNLFVHLQPSPISLPEFELRVYTNAGETPKLTALRAGAARVFKK